MLFFWKIAFFLRHILNLLDNQTFLILYDLHKRNIDLLKFNSEKECRAAFCYWNFRNEFRCYNKVIIPEIEATNIFLKRFVYCCLLEEMIYGFARHNE